MILTYFVISISLIFQLSCAQVREQPVTVVASPTSKPANAARPEKQNSDGKLDQDDLTDVTKLVERHRNATKEDKDNASTLFAESKKEFEKGKYTVAGQGFMESASIFPTIESTTTLCSSHPVFSIQISMRTLKFSSCQGT